MPEDPSHLYLPRSPRPSPPRDGQLDLFAQPSPADPSAGKARPAPPASPLFPGDGPSGDALRSWSPPPASPRKPRVDATPLFGNPRATDDVITPREGKPPLITGIYRKPRAPAAPLILDISARDEDSDEDAPGTLPSASRILRAVRDYFAAAPFPPWMRVSLLAALPLVFLAAWLSVPHPRASAPAAPSVQLAGTPAEIPPAPLDSPAPESPRTDAPAAETPPPPPPPSADALALAKKLSFKGARVTPEPDGSFLVVFDAPVFVSSAYISPDGMKLLKAAAASIVSAFPDGARVSVRGHTDDTPPSGPRTNADIAAARAQAAADQLVSMTRHASRYAIAPAPPADPPLYPFPNDTPANRRLNRTVTLLLSAP